MLENIDWSLSPTIATLIFALGYVLGSIPFGLIITQFAGLGDVRKIGSGNIGATNVLRTGNKALAALTLFTDILKGFAAVFVAANWGPQAAALGGLAAFLGHLFPVWLNFKGGKGVATYIGVLLGLYWPACLVFCATWLGTAIATRYSSLSAILGSLSAPALLAYYEKWNILLVIALMTILLLVRHHANIARLLQGTESKIGAT